MDANLVDRKKRSITLCTWTTSNYLQKMKKNWKLSNTQSSHRNEIWHRKMCHASNEKW